MTHQSTVPRQKLRINALKIIGKWQDTRMVQVTEKGISLMMCRVARVDEKTVSSEYQAKHLMLSHQWTDAEGSVSIDEILKYRDWEP